MAAISSVEKALKRRHQLPATRQRRMDWLIQASKRRELTPREKSELNALLDDAQMRTAAYLEHLIDSRRSMPAKPRRRAAASQRSAA